MNENPALDHFNQEQLLGNNLDASDTYLHAVLIYYIVEK